MNMDIIKIVNLESELRNMANMPNILMEPIIVEYVAKIKDDLAFITSDVKKEHPILSEHLKIVRDNLFVHRYGNPNLFINPFATGQILEVLDTLIAFHSSRRNDLWHYIHPLIIRSSQKLYLDGHYANASVDAFIEINDRIKKVYRKLNPEDEKVPDGVDLMHKIMGKENVNLLQVGNSNTETGRNIQQGYHFMFAGAMSALRNPKAHSNDEKLSPEEAMRRLMFASMLMYKIDEVKL